VEPQSRTTTGTVLREAMQALVRVQAHMLARIVVEIRAADMAVELGTVVCISAGRPKRRGNTFTPLIFIQKLTMTLQLKIAALDVPGVGPTCAFCVLATSYSSTMVQHRSFANAGKKHSMRFS
jgi:hypothetical protein